jgi:AcrR family transcriptional regulator
MMERQIPQRRTAGERREEVIQAAIVEFATYGYFGGSTERIAQVAGISQPYVQRLFGTKKALFIASLERVSDDIIEAWDRALKRNPGGTPVERLEAIGEIYQDFVRDVVQLRLVLQGASSAEDVEIRLCIQTCMGRMFDWVRNTTGASSHQVRDFFAYGMMLTVAASIRAMDATATGEWARAMLLMPLE